MARPAMGRHAANAKFAARAFGNGGRAQPQRLQHPQYGPLRQQLERSFGDRHECKIAALADVETARAGLKFAAVVDETGEILGVLARDPIVLDRSTALPARCDVEKAEAVWPEQPLVAGDGDKVRIDASHVERQRADRLGRIHAERGADAATCRADRLEVDQPAIGPMTMRDGDDCGRAADAGEQRRGPIVIARPRYRYERGAGPLG